MLEPHDLTQLLISTALSLLLGAVADSTDPDVARNYIDTFILPAIANAPGHPSGSLPRSRVAVGLDDVPTYVVAGTVSPPRSSAVPTSTTGWYGAEDAGRDIARWYAETYR